MYRRLLICESLFTKLKQKKQHRNSKTIKVYLHDMLCIHNINRAHDFDSDELTK